VRLFASHIHWRLAADVSQVFNLTRLEDAADDTEGVRQRPLSERRAVKRHYYRAENGIAYFLNRGRVMVQREMEKPGSPMRWLPSGAQAMLDLRATYLNGEWNDFWKFHVQREDQRLYGRIESAG
jgi:hypothetical protein